MVGWERRLGRWDGSAYGEVQICIRYSKILSKMRYMVKVVVQARVL